MKINKKTGDIEFDCASSNVFNARTGKRTFHKCISETSSNMYRKDPIGWHKELLMDVFHGEIQFTTGKYKEFRQYANAQDNLIFTWDYVPASYEGKPQDMNWEVWQASEQYKELLQVIEQKQAEQKEAVYNLFLEYEKLPIETLRVKKGNYWVRKITKNFLKYGNENNVKTFKTRRAVLEQELKRFDELSAFEIFNVTIPN